jgi:hypothetical protein
MLPVLLSKIVKGKLLKAVVLGLSRALVAPTETKFDDKALAQIEKALKKV